jgi:hypothetical protein
VLWRMSEEAGYITGAVLPVPAAGNRGAWADLQ